LPRTTKEKYRKPTVEEFLVLKPCRSEYEWHTDDQGLVHIVVPKFQSGVGKKFCKVVRKKDSFTADMDKIGSFIWKRCDGVKTVKEILDELTAEFSDQQQLDQRLFLFLQQMNQLNYIYY